MKLLFLSRWFPWPADNGARLRAFHLIKALSTRHEVHLVSFAEDSVNPAALGEMRRWCTTVDVVPYRTFRPGSARALAAFFDARPRSVVATHSPSMEAAVRRAGRFQLVLASEIDMAPYALMADAHWSVLDGLEVGVRADAARNAVKTGTRLRQSLTWWKLSNYVRGLLRQFDAVTMVSEAEQALAMQLAPAGRSIDVIPNGVEATAAAKITRAPIPATLIYAGALTYHANYDAVLYFLSEIFPRLRQRFPELTFTVTGKTEGVDLAGLPRQAGVHFSGYLDNVWPAIAGSWISVVPLRVGGGTRLKVLESLALGTPVVATRKGAEGLELEDGRDILLADTPEAFAEAVGRVLVDPTLRTALSSAGCRAASRYDWSIIGERLLALIERVTAPGVA